MFMQFGSTTSAGTLTQLPYEQRDWPIDYRNPEGTIGERKYPINYEEVYNLKGRLLTLIDATFTDPAQRKAFKDVAWQTVRSWMEDIERRPSVYPVEGDGNCPQQSDDSNG